MHCNTLQHTATHCNTLHQLITLDNGAGSNVTNRYEIESSVINAVVGGLPQGTHCKKKKKKEATHTNLEETLHGSLIQGGEDAWDALSSQVTFRKRALYSVALLRKVTCN